MADTGKNTATRTRVVAIMGAVTSRMASTVAGLDSIPLAILTWTASTTTMASSTTIPMASTSPSKDRLFTVKPNSGNATNAPSRETGMAMVGIRVARQSWIKIKTTKITRARAITRVSMISLIPLVMGSVASSDTSYRIPLGKDLDSWPITDRICLARFTALDPGA